MPAIRFAGETVRIRAMDVLGMDGAPPGSNYIRHAGLAGDGHASYNPSHAVLTIIDMQPPLQRGSGRKCDVHGTAEVSDDESRRIAVFVDSIEGEYQAQGVRERCYVAHPPAAPVRARDGTIRYTRFSCAGFVREAYRRVGIELIEEPDTEFPRMSLEMLCNSYPDQAVALRNPRVRSLIGLESMPAETLPILLPGHLINSLARHVSEIRSTPFSPRPGDECFPTKRPAPPEEQGTPIIVDS